MKILIFNWRDLKHSWAGGGEIYVFEMAKRWVSMGNEVTVFCSQDVDKKLPETEQYSGINIIRKGSRFSLYFWAPYYYLTKLRGKFDVVIDVENGIPFFTPLFVRKPKVSFVYHVHGKQFFYELSPVVSHIGYMIERYVFPLFYRWIPVIAISNTTKDGLIKLGFNKNKISIVRCGIIGVKNGKLKKKFSKPTILYLGRIKAYKRVDFMIKNFHKISEIIPGVRMIIAGWGTEASALTDMVMKSKYRRSINLIGPVSETEKRNLLSKSWVFVNPSIGEGWSIAVIEANYYGTPAVAFNVTGLSESILHKKTGFLAKNEDLFVKHVCDILSDKQLRTRLSKNAIEWSRTFNWDDAAKKSLHILKKNVHRK